MEYEDELDRMRNRKRRPAVRQTEIKKQTVSRRYAEQEKRQGTRKRQEMRLEYEDFSDARQANRSRKAVNSKAARRFLYVWKFTGSGQRKTGKWSVKGASDGSPEPEDESSEKKRESRK